METQRPLLKDEDGEEVDVHMYRYQVNLKVSHLHVVKRNFRYLKGQPRLGLWYPKDLSFDLVAYTDSDYARASLDRKSTTRDEALNKELGDSLVRDATTVSSLKAEQDSGGGPKCHEIIRDTTAQTRVLDLEKTMTNQSNEICSLKRKAKKLKKRNRSRTHKLKRLYKVGLTAMVESSRDKESLDEDASKQGMIKAIDADEDITLVNEQDDAKMFDVNDSGGEGVFVAEQEVVKDVNANVVEKVVNAAQDNTATTTITTKEITLAQALEASKTSKPKVKGIVIHKQEELDEKEKDDLKQLMETIPDEEEVAIDAIPLADKSFRIVDLKIHKVGKKSYYQIVKANGKSQIEEISPYTTYTFNDAGKEASN
nr:hypothetical protein [Tanacetum cinerariifolium]